MRYVQVYCFELAARPSGPAVHREKSVELDVLFGIILITFLSFISDFLYWGEAFSFEGPDFEARFGLQF